MDSDEQIRLDRLTEIAVRHHETLAKIEAMLPGLREEVRRELFHEIAQIEPALIGELHKLAAKLAEDASRPIIERAELSAAQSQQLIQELSRSVQEVVELAGKALPQRIESALTEGVERMRAEIDERARTEFAAIPKLKPCGYFHTGETYSQLDVVSFQGSSFIANKRTRQRPGFRAGDWTLLARAGTSSGSPQNIAIEGGGEPSEIDGGGP